MQPVLVHVIAATSYFSYKVTVLCYFRYYHLVLAIRNYVCFCSVLTIHANTKHVTHTKT